MIFQIDYKSNNKYNSYFQYNKRYELNDYKLYDEIEINKFLKEYNYWDIFQSFNVEESVLYAKNAILCDAIRLMILYEFGGVYVDADVYFTDKIYSIEKQLENAFGDRTIILATRSFFFMAAQPKSPYIKMILNLYLNSTILTLDVFMLRKTKLSEFSDELMIISEKYTEQFFKHEQITTAKK